MVLNNEDSRLVVVSLSVNLLSFVVDIEDYRLADLSALIEYIERIRSKLPELP
jgi:hypothetical protein